ncbi:gas vesicle protein [Frankia sp. AiPa1]|nr:gas vesicle protein [Frankia sp. AiPa1]
MGQEPERVTGARRTDSGWSLLVDLTELERIPSTTSVLATYRLDVDESGGLVGYERLRRFVRGATD